MRNTVIKDKNVGLWPSNVIQSIETSGWRIGASLLVLILNGNAALNHPPITCKNKMKHFSKDLMFCFLSPAAVLCLSARDACCSFQIRFYHIGSDGALIYNCCFVVLLSCRGLWAALAVGLLLLAAPGGLNNRLHMLHLFHTVHAIYTIWAF